MRLFVALRLLNEQHAKPAIEAKSRVEGPGGVLIDANIARHHPALKNIWSYLISAGLLPEKRRAKVSLHDGIEREAELRLYWCEVETELTAEDWRLRQNVEMVIAKDEFSKFAASIRHKAGASYVIACEKYALTMCSGSARDISPRISVRSTGQML